MDNANDRVYVIMFREARDTSALPTVRVFASDKSFAEAFVALKHNPNVTILGAGPWTLEK